MDAATWERERNVLEMLTAIGARASGRKLRLFALACCRRREDLIRGGRWREALDLLDRMSEERVSERQIKAIRSGLSQAPEDQAVSARLDLLLDDETTFWGAYHIAALLPDGQSGVRAAVRAQPAILRDVMGHLFYPTTIDPAWLRWERGLPGHLARIAYDGRAFDRLPVLADAMEDAGCDQAEFLAHLRGGSPHVRGCWALDLCLGLV